jgi:hypothetical protein
MTPREKEEYRALRATIRQRGTIRPLLLLAGFLGWAVLLLATAALVALPLATLLPLLILAVAFETSFGLYIGVERIGRYLQVFFEGDGAEPGWEHRIMAFGGTAGAPTADPLLAAYFCVATIANFMPAMLVDPLPIEWAMVGVVHALFLVRVVAARRQATSQRIRDLERFRALKQGESRGEEGGGGRSAEDR